MLQLIMSHVPSAGCEAVLKMIKGGTITRGTPWSETSSLLVTELQADFGRYFKATIADTAGLREVAELTRLERELRKDLIDCVVDIVRHDRTHRFFPGSKSFVIVTIFGG